MLRIPSSFKIDNDKAILFALAVQCVAVLDFIHSHFRTNFMYVNAISQLKINALIYAIDVSTIITLIELIFKMNIHNEKLNTHSMNYKTDEWPIKILLKVVDRFD